MISTETQFLYPWQVLQKRDHCCNMTKLLFITVLLIASLGLSQAAIECCRYKHHASKCSLGDYRRDFNYCMDIINNSELCYNRYCCRYRHLVGACFWWLVHSSVGWRYWEVFAWYNLERPHVSNASWSLVLFLIELMIYLELVLKQLRRTYTVS